jgi:hypothetical protein
VRARKEQKQIPHPARNAGIRDYTLCAARLPPLFFAFDPMSAPPRVFGGESVEPFSPGTFTRGAKAGEGCPKTKKAGDISRLGALFYQESVPQLNITALVLYVCIGLCLSPPRGPHLENLPSVPGAHPWSSLANRSRPVYVCGAQAQNTPHPRIPLNAPTRSGDQDVEVTEKKQHPVFGFSSEWNLALGSRKRRLPQKNLPFGKSRIGGGVIFCAQSSSQNGDPG